MNFQADTKMKARKGNNNDQIKFGRQKQRAASYIGDKQDEMGEAINADSLLLTCKVFEWLTDDYLEIMYKAHAYRYITNAKYNTSLLGK